MMNTEARQEFKKEFRPPMIYRKGQKRAYGVQVESLENEVGSFNANRAVLKALQSKEDRYIKKNPNGVRIYFYRK